MKLEATELEVNCCIQSGEGRGGCGVPETWNQSGKPERLVNSELQLQQLSVFHQINYMLEKIVSAAVSPVY